ncbi:MAG: hypothetical protein GPJ54_01835 [Candidatus Heimdallarchaeota archaeon]|nr:hypothetical protein [Candidatus Heimdallarchaeota archaeon]
MTYQYSTRGSLNLGEKLVLQLFGKMPTIYGKTRIQKLIFLFQIENPQFNLFEFKAHYFGPYCKILDLTLEGLVLNGLIDEEVSENRIKTDILYLTKYSLTSYGCYVTEDGYGDFLHSFHDILNSFIDRYGYLKQKELLEEAYKYKEYTINSVILNDFDIDEEDIVSGNFN